MFKKSELTYREQVQRKYFFSGLLWCLVGIFSFIDTIWAKAAVVIFLLIMVYIHSSTLNRNGEEADEMAEQDLNKAQANTYSYGDSIIMLIVVICGLATTIGNWKINIPFNYFYAGFCVLIGCRQATVWLLFRKYEDE